MSCQNSRNIQEITGYLTEMIEMELTYFEVTNWTIDTTKQVGAKRSPPLGRPKNTKKQVGACFQF